MTQVRVRFAPSPTGYLHIGGARTALFNYLFAKKMGGKFILRLEDTDQARLVPDSVDDIFASLKWLGFEFPDECYVQSDRLRHYEDAARVLLECNFAYYCFCPKDSKESCSCFNENSEEKLKLMLSMSVPHTIKFKIPRNIPCGYSGREHDTSKTKFMDTIRGPIEVSNSNIEDFIIIKSDGFPTYHLASVVDDHFMGITHVFRGEEWLSSTPRHILLYEAFAWEPPQYIHLPTILDETGKKLSKRDHAASVMDFRKAGFLPEALVNHIALLGWNPGDSREKMSMKELIETFSVEKINPKAAIFDETKLRWMNGLYLAETHSMNYLTQVAGEWVSRGLDIKNVDLLKVIDLMKVRSKTINEMVDSSMFFFKDPETYDEKGRAKFFDEMGIILLEIAKIAIEATQDSFTADNLKALFERLKEQAKDPLYKVTSTCVVEIIFGSFNHPVRLALTGVTCGPGLFEIMEVLGKETVLRRLTKAIEQASTS